MVNLRLRTKFLLSMVAISAGLTATSLLLVRRTIEQQVRSEIRVDLRNSVLAFQNAQRLREATLRRSAELVANLPILRALMTTEHPPTIQDASRDLWRLAGSSLFVLADRSGAIVAIHGAGENDRAFIQDSFSRSIGEEQGQHWWCDRNHLYEVSLQPIYFGAPSDNRLLGFLAVGYEIDDRVARELSQIAGSQVAFRYGADLVRSTLPPAQQAEFRRLDSGNARATAPAPSEVQLGSERFLVSSLDLGPDKNPTVRLTVLKSLDQAVAFLGRLNRLLLGLGLLAVIAGSALVFVVSRTFTRPLDSLVAGVRALAAGDYDHPLQVHGNDEVAELTAAFSRMRASLQESQRELLEAERLATIGRMASSISHDLRHHLAAIVANAEFLSDVRRTGPERQELYQELRAAVNQMTDLIDSLLEFTRPRESLRRAPVHVQDVLERAMQTVRAYPEFQHVHIDIVHGPLSEGWFDASKLQRVFQNLIINACESVGTRSGRVEITMTETPQELEIRVADNGRGVPESIRARIFEPFVSAGKENGTGLGLTVVQKIVQDHGGEVKMSSTSSTGTVFTVRLPRMRALQDAGAEADAARSIVHGAD